MYFGSNFISIESLTKLSPLTPAILVMSVKMWHIYREFAERSFPAEYELTHSLYTEASNTDWEELAHR